MSCRFLAKIAAVVCAVCIAMAVMSQTVFARDDSLDAAELPAQPEATLVVLDGEGVSPSPEVTDNRQTLPLYIGQEKAGECSMVNGEPYMGVSAFCKAIGLNGQIIDYGSALSLSANGMWMTAQAGQEYFICNDRYLYVDNGVQDMDGALALPVEALIKCAGLTGYWDRVQWRLTLEDGEPTPLELGETYYDETDLYWLSRMICVMAEGEPLEAKVAVGSVCVNRLHDDTFAGQSNIYEVVFAKNEFGVVTNGMIYTEPDETSILAAKLALEGGDPTGGATYMADRDMGAGYECVARLGNLRFFTAA